MLHQTELKELVKEKYSEIAAKPKEQHAASCCGATNCCSDEMYNVMAEDYTRLEGYNPDADLGLGCGLPIVFAKIKDGDTVIDLGSGAGNDCFVARAAAGKNGKIIGIDFTEKMIERARMNAEKLGYNNVEFRPGDIESMPVTSNMADVIVSNCVLNLVPNKHKVFSEVFRVLKPGGHFSISDIVLQGVLPKQLKETAEMYAGCVAGASQKTDYLSIIEEAGFTNIMIQKERKIAIPAEILLQYLSEDQPAQINESETGIYSITVYAEKPAKETNLSSTTACCGDDCCKN